MGLMGRARYLRAKERSSEGADGDGKRTADSEKKKKLTRSNKISIRARHIEKIPISVTN